jgi:hyperosmotically inducible periplasmic protein
VRGAIAKIAVFAMFSWHRLCLSSDRDTQPASLPHVGNPFMNVRLSAALALSAVLAAPGVALSQPATRLSQDVAKLVRENPQLTIFDHVDFRVEGSTVFLDGQVTNARKKVAVERKASSLDGVTDLRTAIIVLPPSPSDDELRQRIARAIYGNPTFWSYAAMSNPPIHIIVERGRVTLRGSVNTVGERTMARSLATGLGELAVTDELVVNR